MDKSGLFTRVNQTHFIPQHDDEVEEVHPERDVFVLSDLGHEIRERFCFRKGYQNPKGPNKLDIHYEAAAEKCKELKADPMKYVDAHFENRDPANVHCQFLCAKNSAELYELYTKAEEIDYPGLLQLFMGTLKLQLKLGRKLEKVLSSKDLHFPAWFRVCIPKEPIPEIDAVYKQLAKKEVTPALIEFLRSMNLDYKRITL